MITPDIILVKHYASEVLNNYEQDQVEKYGTPLVANKVSYKTTVYDKTTKVVRNEETLTISIINYKNVKFKANDVIEIAKTKEKWVIDRIESPDPFKPLDKKYVLTLKR